MKSFSSLVIHFADERIRISWNNYSTPAHLQYLITNFTQLVDPPVLLSHDQTIYD